MFLRPPAMCDQHLWNQRMVLNDRFDRQLLSMMYLFYGRKRQATSQRRNEINIKSKELQKGLSEPIWRTKNFLSSRLLKDATQHQQSSSHMGC